MSSPSSVLLSRFFLVARKCARPQSCKCLPIFNQKKCYNPLSPPVLSRFISARLFSVPQVENEIKMTQLCRCCQDPRSHNWWIKEGPKRGIFGSFSETVWLRKSLYICQWSFFELKKKKRCLPHVSSIFNKISPKTFGPHCVLLVNFILRYFC